MRKIAASEFRRDLWGHLSFHVIVTSPQSGTPFLLANRRPLPPHPGADPGEDEGMLPSHRLLKIAEIVLRCVPAIRACPIQADPDVYRFYLWILKSRLHLRYRIGCKKNCIKPFTRNVTQRDTYKMQSSSTSGPLD